MALVIHHTPGNPASAQTATQRQQNFLNNVPRLEKMGMGGPQLDALQASAQASLKGRQQAISPAPSAAQDQNKGVLADKQG